MNKFFDQVCTFSGHYNQLIKIINNNQKLSNIGDIMIDINKNKDFLDQSKLDLIKNQLNEINYPNLVVNDQKYRVISAKK